MKGPYFCGWWPVVNHPSTPPSSMAFEKWSFDRASACADHVEMENASHAFIYLQTDDQVQYFSQIAQGNYWHFDRLVVSIGPCL